MTPSRLFRNDAGRFVDVTEKAGLATVPEPATKLSSRPTYGVTHADLNNDGVVNAIDLGALKLVFFTADADADFNGDGAVNPIDLGVMKSSFFGPPGPSGIAP